MIIRNFRFFFAFALACVLSVDSGHLCLHLTYLIIADGGFVFIKVVKIEVKDVGGTFLFWVAHTEHRGPHLHTLKLIVKDVSPLVALDDASGLPTAYLIQELTPWYAYLAHEQLIEVEGG